MQGEEVIYWFSLKGVLTSPKHYWTQSAIFKHCICTLGFYICNTYQATNLREAQFTD